MSYMTKIVIFGNGQAPIETIEFLRGFCEVLVVVDTQDKAEDYWQLSLEKYCKDNSVRYLKPIKFLDKEFLANLRRFYPDLILSIQTRKLIKKEIIDLVDGEIFNVHFAALPKNRGCYPGLWHILNGDKYAGITLHKLTEGIDDGAIIDQIRKEIAVTDTTRSLYEWCACNTYILVKRNIEALIAKRYKAQQQNDKEASYYSRNSVNFENLYINWNKTGDEVARYIQAFIFPPLQYPLARIDKEEINIEGVSLISKKKRVDICGTILSSKGKFAEVQVADGSIVVKCNRKLKKGEIVYI